MLVISRRKGQSFLIGDDIEVVVTAVHRSSVKLAVRAPKHLTVLRAEIAEDYGETPSDDEAARAEEDWRSSE